jgi:hypothetical protein
MSLVTHCHQCHRRLEDLIETGPLDGAMGMAKAAEPLLEDICSPYECRTCHTSSLLCTHQPLPPNVAITMAGYSSITQRRERMHTKPYYILLPAFKCMYGVLAWKQHIFLLSNLSL